MTACAMDADTVEVIKKLVVNHQGHGDITRLTESGPVSVEPLAGGHLNHVARIRSANGNHSCIVKVYMNYVKFLGPSMPIELERCERDYLATCYFRSLMPTCCPQAYFYDDTHHVGFFQDYPDYQEWGQVLLTHCDLECGADLVHMLVRLHSSSYRGRLTDPEFRTLCNKFRPLPQQVNFVVQAQFVKPLLPTHRDYKPHCSEQVRSRVDQVIGSEVVTRASQLARKWLSQDDGNCCIHGDLHLENIMYHRQNKKITLIDTDSVRVGPEAYDLGLLVSNYVLLYQYHRDMARSGQSRDGGPDHGHLKNQMSELIESTLSIYLSGMCQILEDKFHLQSVWHQIVVIMGLEIIGWISGPASFHFIDSRPQVMLACLETGYNSLLSPPVDVTELVRRLRD